MGWRYYAQRATTGEWLDTNVQFSDEAMSWMLSSPNAGQALIPVGIGNPKMQDKRPLFGKFDTILLVEDENEDLIWFGICTEANPVEKGTSVEFIGLMGWAAGVPYLGEYVTWKRPLFDVVREVLKPLFADKIKPNFPINFQFVGGAGLSIGDPEPPVRPEVGERAEGVSDHDWKLHTERIAHAQAVWQELHGWKQPYELLWWEAPMVGKEIDDIVKQYGINYIETVEWVDRSKLKYRVNVTFDDGLVGYQRADIEFVDGINLLKPVDVKPGNAKFANRVIGLGAGEGRDMLRVDLGSDDGRMYQAEILNYKAISSTDQLRRMAQHDLKFLRADGTKVETLTVWDAEGMGFASITSLIPGNSVRIKSDYSYPPIDQNSRIVSITRVPNSAAAVINFEVSR